MGEWVSRWVGWCSLHPHHQLSASRLVFVRCVFSNLKYEFFLLYVKIIGPPGIGTTSVARAVASYIHERPQALSFHDGIYEISVKGCATSKDISRRISDVLEFKHGEGLDNHSHHSQF